MVGAVLAVVSLVALTGSKVVFVLGALLSVAVVLVVAATWGAYLEDYTLLVAVLATITLVTDILASMSSSHLAEKDSPLNLPVFG